MSRRYVPTPQDKIEAARRKLRSRDPAVRKAAEITVGKFGDYWGYNGHPSARRLCECERTVMHTDADGEIRCLFCGHEVLP